MGGPLLVKFGPGSSVRLSICSSISSSNGRRRVCCWAPPRMQAISIDSRRRRSPANAGSVVLSADVGGWTQTCSFLRHFSVLCATPDRRPRMSYFQSYFSSVHLYRCLHGWQWRDVVSYLCHLIFAAILWVKTLRNVCHCDSV